MSAPDIFLSYNREDADVAQVFADAFAREGMDVWWDVTLRSGETYDEVTEAALRGAKAVVVLWSPRSVASHWVRAEATIAHRAKTLVPATIEPCDKPVMFELTQTAELSHWRGETEDKAWLTFLGDVRGRIGGTAPETKTAPGSATPTGRSGIPKVAVFPITCRGGEELEFLAEDLTEEITRELARSSFSEVTAAQVMVAWRDKPFDHRALGKELDVRYLVQGKLQRAGDSIRLTMQIIDTASGDMLWSKRFVRKLDELETSPEELPEHIAGELGGGVWQIEQSRAMAKSGPFSAWEHIMRAWAYQGRMGTDSMRLSIEEGRQAIKLAPDFGLAHGLLAMVLSTPVTTGGAELDDALRNEIRTHLTRALQIDGDNPRVINWIIAPYGGIGDDDAALRLSRSQVERYPNSPGPYICLGFALELAGQTGEAITAYENQVRLTAFDVNRYNGLANLGRCLVLEGRPVEAEAALDQSLALHPDYASALKWKAIAAAMMGNEATALAMVMRLREVEPTRSIDQHVRQMLFYKRLADRLAEPIATLRRLWDATEGEATSA